MNAVDTENENKRNIIDVVSNVVYLYQDYFNKLSIKEKIEAMSIVALIFNTLLDEEINPLTKRYTLKALKCFNDNIINEPEDKGCECEMYDEYNQCCMWDRLEKVVTFPWEKEVDPIIEDCLSEMP
ncbi:MAG TPA: hypothetical protein GXX36_10540 [Clostridiaceae bacterium]|nr:hypothetical protein [Clostridiaceae bacterium]